MTTGSFAQHFELDPFEADIIRMSALALVLKLTQSWVHGHLLGQTRDVAQSRL